jgi:hypothetical protein
VTALPPRGAGGSTLTASDVSGLLYGAGVSGATLAVVGAHADASSPVVLATLLVLTVYWLAHVYVEVVASQLGGDDSRALHRRLATSLREEASVLLGGLPAVAVYVGAVVLGASKTTAGFVALGSLVLLLFVVGLFGARRAGLRGGAALLEASGAGVFGVLIVALKAVLH